MFVIVHCWFIFAGVFDQPRPAQPGGAEGAGGAAEQRVGVRQAAHAERRRGGCCCGGRQLGLVRGLADGAGHARHPGVHHSAQPDGRRYRAAGPPPAPAQRLSRQQQPGGRQTW